MQNVRCGKILEVNFDSKVVTFKIANEDKSSWYSISYKVFLEEGLYEGMLISEEELDKLVYLEDKYELLEIAYNALRYKDLSKNEIYERLSKRNYDDCLIEEVINELEDKGYINDLSFISNYIDEAIDKRYGKKKIEYELINKGIDSKLIYSKLDSISDEEEYERGLLAAKKYYKSRQNSKNIKIKIQQHLYNLGYETSCIQQIISIIFNDINDYY